MDQKFQDLLSWFGFTEKERETYLSILQNGPVTVQEVVAETDVSRRHVYNIIERLEKYQFIIKNDYITPTTLEPAPPDQVYDELQEQSQELYHHIDTEYQQQKEIIDEIKVLKSRSTIIRKIKEMISSAEYRVAISIPLNFLASLEDVLREAVNRDLAVLVLIFEDGTNEISSTDFSLDGVANVIRYRETSIPVLLTVDRVSALVAPQTVITQSAASMNAIFMGQPYLNPIVFTALMNTEWILGDELYVSPPQDLPHTYNNFPRAAIDATLHLQEDVLLRATIEGQPQDSGNITEVSGVVQNVNQRFIEPIESPRPGQTSLEIKTDNGVFSVGGKDGFLEDYKAHMTTIEEAD